MQRLIGLRTFLTQEVDERIFGVQFCGRLGRKDKNGGRPPSRDPVGGRPEKKMNFKETRSKRIPTYGVGIAALTWLE